MHQVLISKNLVTISGETPTFKYMAFFEVKGGFTLEDGLTRIITTPLDKDQDHDPSHQELAALELRQWVEGNLEVLQVAATLSLKLECESTIAALAARLEARVEAYEGSRKVVLDKPS